MRRCLFELTQKSGADIIVFFQKKSKAKQSIKIPNEQVLKSYLMAGSLIQ
jgi:hypothetical protein